MVEPITDGLKIGTITIDSVATAEVLSKISEDTQNRFKILYEDTKDEKVKKIINELMQKTKSRYSENLTNAFIEGYLNEIIKDDFKDSAIKVCEKASKYGAGIVTSAILGGEIGSMGADSILNSKDISEKDIKVISCLVIRNSILDALNTKLNNYLINHSNEARNSLIYSFENLVLIDLQGAELFAELIESSSTSLVNKILNKIDKDKNITWDRCKTNCKEDINKYKSFKEVLSSYLVPIKDNNSYDKIVNDIDAKIDTYNNQNEISFTRTNDRGYIEHYTVHTQGTQIFNISYYEGDWNDHVFYYDGDKIIKIYVPTAKGDEYYYYFNNDNLILKIHYGEAHELIEKKYFTSNETNDEDVLESLNLGKMVLNNAKNYLRK